jgi:hypothetical protein
MSCVVHEESEGQGYTLMDGSIDVYCCHLRCCCCVGAAAAVSSCPANSATTRRRLLCSIAEGHNIEYRLLVVTVTVEEATHRPCPLQLAAAHALTLLRNAFVSGPATKHTGVGCLSFPCVCPEPVLANDRVSQGNG